MSRPAVCGDEFGVARSFSVLTCINSYLLPPPPLLTELLAMLAAGKWCFFYGFATALPVNLRCCFYCHCCFAFNSSLYRMFILFTSEMYCFSL